MQASDLFYLLAYTSHKIREIILGIIVSAKW